MCNNSQFQCMLGAGHTFYYGFIFLAFLVSAFLVSAFLLLILPCSFHCRLSYIINHLYFLYVNLKPVLPVHDIFKIHFYSFTLISWPELIFADKSIFALGNCIFLGATTYLRQSWLSFWVCCLSFQALVALLTAKQRAGEDS